MKLQTIAADIILALAACTCIAGCVSAPQGTGDSGDWEAKQGIFKDQVVRQNMRNVQIAAEHYAADHGGNVYPSAIDDSFKAYFPGGIEGQRPAPVGPANPFTGVNEFPTIAHIPSVASVRSGNRFDITPGAIQYCPLGGGKAYAIVGGAHDGKALMDVHHPTQVLVLTNLAH